MPATMKNVRTASHSVEEYLEVATKCCVCYQQVADPTVKWYGTG